jgi:hypothetical protein
MAEIRRLIRQSKKLHALIQKELRLIAAERRGQSRNTPG